MLRSRIVLTAETVRPLLPPRDPGGHKGTFGRDYILGGSVGCTGAPVLAASAAMRSGAGLVFLDVPETVYPIVAGNCRESMPRPVPDAFGKVSELALPAIRQHSAGCAALLLGCGLGRGDGVEEVVWTLLRETEQGVVLDADGINALAGHIDILDGRRGRTTILTPHAGEFARIGGDTAAPREEAAAAFAAAHGCVLVLKGPGTVVAAPEGTVYVNTTGNCGMAKGGSGDVLAGMVLALLGQGAAPAEAAAAAVWLHGLAGDLAAAEKTAYAMLPSDLVERLPEAFRTLL